MCREEHVLLCALGVDAEEYVFVNSSNKGHDITSQWLRLQRTGFSAQCRVGARRVYGHSAVYPPSRHAVNYQYGVICTVPNTEYNGGVRWAMLLRFRRLGSSQGQQAFDWGEKRRENLCRGEAAGCFLLGFCPFFVLLSVQCTPSRVRPRAKQMQGTDHRRTEWRGLLDVRRAPQCSGGLACSCGQVVLLGRTQVPSRTTRHVILGFPQVFPNKAQ